MVLRNKATTVKVKYEDAMRLLTLPARNLSLSELEEKVRDLFKIPLGPLMTTYTDIDKDVVTMVCDKDVEDALIIQGLNPLYISVKLDNVMQPSKAQLSEPKLFEQPFEPRPFEQPSRPFQFPNQWGPPATSSKFGQWGFTSSKFGQPVSKFDAFTNKPGGDEEEKIHVETLSYEEGRYHDYAIKKLDTMIASSKDEKNLIERGPPSSVGKTPAAGGSGLKSRDLKVDKPILVS